MPEIKKLRIRRNFSLSPYHINHFFKNSQDVALIYSFFLLTARKLRQYRNQNLNAR